MKKYYLYPGKFFTSTEETEISTILGSCVGIALYDSISRIGGLNHYLLPKPVNGATDCARYGSYAIPALIQAMESLGANRKNLQAKVFGGASVLGEVSQDIEIGNHNIELAEKILSDLKIPIVERNVGGKIGRKIYLNSANFEIRHQFLNEKKGELDLSGQQRLFVPKTCKVLIVDDSATVRNLFQKIFQKHGLTVVGCAANPYEARELIVEKKPDVITLDIEMPMMNGVAFLEKLMQHFPIPVVMVSSLGSQGAAALRALELGAIEFVQKPSQFEMDKLQGLAEMLVEKVKGASMVNVIRKLKSQEGVQKIVSTPTSSGFKAKSVIQVIGVSGNTGSQASLETFLKNLPSDSPPVVVVNSTVSLFLEAYLKKLQSKVQVQLALAKDGDILRMGNVYFGQPGGHLYVQSRSGSLNLQVKQGSPVHGQVPSGTVLFESIANSAGDGAVGILLSGFGADGLEGLEMIQSAGGLTIAEDPASASFPLALQSAVNQGIADEIMSPEQISNLIMDVRNKRVA
ncbi:MAG: hypothetical protein BroJett040_02420 [Oligoflexia bacterium]|nr:MAG: hypothetical protein BroJett040_02420 [Oligoflexia bacterium]